MKGKVNHGEGRGKAASWELATNWNKKKKKLKQGRRKGGVYGRILMVKICKGGNVSRYKVKADNLHTFLHISVYFSDIIICLPNIRL